MTGIAMREQQHMPALLPRDRFSSSWAVGLGGTLCQGALKGIEYATSMGLWYTAHRRRTEGDQPRLPALPAAVAALLVSPMWSVAIRTQTTR